VGKKAQDRNEKSLSEGADNLYQVGFQIFGVYQGSDGDLMTQLRKNSNSRSQAPPNYVSSADKNS